MTMTSNDPLTIAFELLAGVPDAIIDPYPRYHALREGAPVLHFDGPFGPMYVLTRYEDCKHALQNPKLGKAEDRLIRQAVSPELADLFADRVPPMLMLNPPDHTRLRGLVSRAFTPRRVEEMRPRIEALVDGLLDGVDGEVELLDVFGFPLPVAVIGELVGVPADRWTEFRTLVRDGAASLELNADEAIIRKSAAALGDMTEIFRGLLREREAEPHDDLLTALLEVEHEGDALTEDELIANVILLFAAGFETTTNLIGNGLVALLEHPEQMQRLRDDPSLIPTAIDELLRWDSPVQVDGRMVLEPTSLPDGTELQPGEQVITILGAANRDPERFADAETFDVGRTDNAPLSFAWGIHHCLGAALARAEGQVAFGDLLERYSQIELLDDPPRWRRSLTLRGLDGLSVRLTT